MAQLFSTSAFSAYAFSLNVLTTFTAIYSQSIVNTFIKENRYLDNNIEFIRIKPIIWE